MALTVLKNTPIHAVVAVSGAGATETIGLATTIKTASQTAGIPVVNITGIHWAMAASDEYATITRDSNVLWSLSGSNDMYFNGWSDNRANTTNIVVVTPATGGTIIIEMVKVSGYGDTQHVNPLT